MTEEKERLAAMQETFRKFPHLGITSKFILDGKGKWGVKPDKLALGVCYGHFLGIRYEGGFAVAASIETLLVIRETPYPSENEGLTFPDGLGKAGVRGLPFPRWWEVLPAKEDIRPLERRAFHAVSKILEYGDVIKAGGELLAFSPGVVSVMGCILTKSATARVFLAGNKLLLEDFGLTLMTSPLYPAYANRKTFPVGFEYE